MNKTLAAVASILFLIVFGLEVLRIQGSFTPSSQNISLIGKELFSSYVVPFELLSLILVGAIAGMFYISWRDE